MRRWVLSFLHGNEQRQRQLDGLCTVARSLPPYWVISKGRPVMEVLGFIAAIIGLIAAILNRKRIIVHRTETVYTPRSEAPVGQTSIRKRLKRFAVAVALGFGCTVIAAIAEPNTNGPITEFMMWPFGICLLVAAYQLVAAIIMVFAGLWR